MSSFLQGLLNSPNMPAPRPAVDDRMESNVRGIYVVGELAGAPVVKLAMEQGYKVAEYISSKPDARSNDPAVYDILVIGAGASGLNAALEAQKHGLRVLVLEKSHLGNTIDELPDGKIIYTEPNDRPVSGSLWLEEVTKEELVKRWRTDIGQSGLDVRQGEGVTSIQRRSDSGFDVTTSKAAYRARRIIVAIGKSGTPRKLEVPGENSDRVHYRLFHPKTYAGQNVLVVGGGNSAVEAAVSLSDVARVTLSYRGSSFYRVSKHNERKLKEAVAAGSLEVILNSNVKQFTGDTYSLETNGVISERPFDHAFILVGSEPPTGFLHSIGLRLENEWTASRFLWLALTFMIAYSIYGIKQGDGHEFWPYTGWGAHALTFFNRPWSFWYTVLYTLVVTVFGIQAMKRWGIDRKDKFQIWRYVSLIGFQWTFFFLIPEFLFQWLLKYQWLSARAGHDAWRSYGLVLAWPLFFYTFFGNPAHIWVVWGILMSFVIIPILVLLHGKRYCSWICGCGGLAETLGDRWRHLAPKGPTSIRWEKMNAVVLFAAAAITVMMLTRDAVTIFRKPSDLGLEWYHFIADTWLVGIIPITLYPFFGGKVWCRYWCPLAKMMELFSAVFARFKVSQFSIQSTDKCIACEECSRNCQVGIDVMRFALKQEEITNQNSSCIGCGICVTVCPMDVLSFAKPVESGTKLVQIQTAA
jgi:NosR/NirI family transcriptional regulator, nitrous oxide reductase regulator